MRHTKIVATIGPATDTDEAIHKLLEAGVDVFRLNFSHGDHASHGAAIARIRAAADDTGRCVAILQDLSGPKIRTGRLRGGTPLTLTPGDTLVIAVGDFEGEPGRVSTTYAPLPSAVRPGGVLLLDDGHLQLRVESVTATEVTTRVVDGGPLGEKKGINVPGATLPTAGMTEKDRRDLRFGISAGVDLVALSFVQSADDLRRARQEAANAGAPDLPFIAKLERPEAVSSLDEILQASDAIMVARGDLGLELPLEQVPRVQKDVTRRARALGKPVIVATQVLESMRVEPRPTRAEVSDAANAVDDGVDAIMLAGETAAGKYPVQAVQTLDRIIRDAETIAPSGRVLLERAPMLAGHGHAICEAAVTMAERGDARAIVAVTRGGHTAHALASFRPRAPIYAAAASAEVSRRLALAWGVVPLVADPGGDVGEAAARIGATLVAKGVLPAGSVVVLVSVSPDLGAGPSNFLKLQRL